LGIVIRWSFKMDSAPISGMSGWGNEGKPARPKAGSIRGYG